MAQWRISREHGVILISFPPGTVIALELILGVYGELNANPEKFGNANLVWDLRDTVPDSKADFDLTSKLVNQIQSGGSVWWKHGKAAMVVNNPVSFGMARMYASLMDGMEGHTVEIFDGDLSSAIAWAGSSG